MTTEAELEQAVIERWTGEQEPASFRIRAKVGADPLFGVYRTVLTARGRLQRVCIDKSNMVPVDTGNDWQWRMIEFIRTT